MLDGSPGMMDGSGGTHGFTSAGGLFNLIDVPCAASTFASGGMVVDYYFERGGTAHGFTASGTTFSSFDAPVRFQSTLGLGINDCGQVAGSFIGAGATHGFATNGNLYRRQRRDPRLYRDPHSELGTLPLPRAPVLSIDMHGVDARSKLPV
jgi:hypothetical protein